MLTLLGAGHDTTAAALAWCFERVLRHPDVLERCRAASGEDDQDYLTAVVNETLRFLGHVPGFGGLYFMVDCICAGFTERKQALHDMIASCLVLRKI